MNPRSKRPGAGRVGVIALALLASAGRLTASEPGGAGSGGGSRKPPVHTLEGLVRGPARDGRVPVELIAEHGRNEYECPFGEKVAARKVRVEVALPTPLQRTSFPGMALHVVIDHDEKVVAARAVEACVVTAAVVRAPAPDATVVEVRLEAAGQRDGAVFCGPVNEAVKGHREVKIGFPEGVRGQLGAGRKLRVGLTNNLNPVSVDGGP